MSTKIFKALISFWGLIFAISLAVVCIPPLLKNPDVISAVMAGFVNPFSTGYALDAIFSGLVLSTWIIYEAKAKKIKHGWVCILLCLVPGVATALAVYILLRMKHEATKD